MRACLCGWPLAGTSIVSRQRERNGRHSRRLPQGAGKPGASQEASGRSARKPRERMKIKGQLLTMAALLRALPLRLWCADAVGRDFEKVSTQDSFANGIPSWQSYPLAQDIGYDPSIYTTTLGGTPVLVRDVINEGQKTQSVGMIRPLTFRLTSSTQIALSYSLHLAGEPLAVKLILAAEDGTTLDA